MEIFSSRERIHSSAEKHRCDSIMSYQGSSKLNLCLINFSTCSKCFVSARTPTNTSSARKNSILFFNPKLTSGGNGSSDWETNHSVLWLMSRPSCSKKCLRNLVTEH